MEVLKPGLINFFGEPIAVIETELEINGRLEPVLGVVAKRLVEQLGIDWKNQFEKLKADSDNRFRAFEARAEGSDGKNYNAVIIPLSSVNAFLFSINREKLSDDAMVTTRLANGEVRMESKKAKLIRYQDECATVLYDYWQHGAAMNFRANPADLDSQKTYDILQTSRKRFDNVLNGLVQSVVDSRGHRGPEAEAEMRSFAGVLSEEVYAAIKSCLNAQELDMGLGLIRKTGEAGIREISGMEAMYVTILENCVCDLIGQYRRKEIGVGDEDYSVILEILPAYFEDYLKNVEGNVVMMRSTFNRGKGLFSQ